jgi:hypothetical protein
LDKLKYDINEIWNYCVDTWKMAHFTATIWHTTSSDISSNKPDTNNFIFSANVYKMGIKRGPRSTHGGQ